MGEDKKKNIAIIFILAIMIILVICAFVFREYKLNEEKKIVTNTKTETSKENNEDDKKDSDNAKNKDKDKESADNIDYIALQKEALENPKKGETIAIIKVKDYGEIKLKFFKDEAPKAVENFLTHAKNGYYNGQIFHRVINEFMIQGGDPTGTGTGGESIWKEPFRKRSKFKKISF